jgi:hypothetical protein
MQQKFKGSNKIFDAGAVNEYVVFLEANLSIRREKSQGDDAF